jgi:uncharacterized membrane protein
VHTNTNEMLELIERMRLQQEAIIKNQKDILERVADLEIRLGVSPEIVPVTTEQVLAKEQLMPPNISDEPAVKKTMLPGWEKFSIKTIPSKDEIEFKIGGTWLNRIGSAAVILGLIFFLKYSFDNQLIGPTGRVIIGLMAGLIMLGTGEKLREKYSVYSQGLIGAGSLALYFSTYTSYGFYNLISPALAFVFLIFVMANTVFTAIRHDALTIGILGIVGGYLAPLIISTGKPLPWVFFGYLSILTCGILAVSIYKRWNSFRVISFAFNHILITFWYFSYYKPAFLVPSFVFVAVNFIAYLSIATGYNIRSKSLINSTETVLIFLNATMFFLWSRLFLSSTFLEEYMGFYSLAIALTYTYIGRLAYRLHQEDKKQAYTLFAAAIKLITIAIYLQLDHKYIAYGWMLQASGIFYLASILKSRMLLAGGLIVLVLANLALPTWAINDSYLAISWLLEALGLFLMGYKLDIREVQQSSLAALGLGTAVALATATSWEFFRYKQFLLNWPSLALLLAIVVTGIMYYLYRRVGEKEEKIKAFLGIAALVLIFAFLSIENHHFFRLFRLNFFLSPEQLSLSLVWMVYAIVLFFAGIKMHIKELRYGALGLIGIIICKAFLVDLEGLATIYKIMLFVILGLFLLGISFVYQKKQNLLNRSENL